MSAGTTERTLEEQQTRGRGTIPSALKAALFGYAFTAVAVLFDMVFRIPLFPHAGGFFVVAVAFINPVCGLLALALSLSGWKARPRANGVAFVLGMGLLAPLVVGALRRGYSTASDSAETAAAAAPPPPAPPEPPESAPLPE